MGRDLETRVRILEEREKIEKLHSRYAYCCDERDWEGVLDCFTEDAVADYGPFGKYEGKKGITKFFKEIQATASSFTIHEMHNPIIEINGDEAKGRWYVGCASTIIKPGSPDRAVWIAGRYDNEFVKENGEWKYKSIFLKVYYVTPYDEGWVKTKMWKE